MEKNNTRLAERQLSPDAIAMERNRYFTGKYLEARDFESEQQYFISRHRLHNRLLHGQGVVCGLTVHTHPNPACAHTHVVIAPGIALDCHGRELIIERKTVIALPEDWKPGLGEEWLLYLEYGEQEIEEVPAYFNDNVCDSGHTEANRVRECVCIRWSRRKDLPLCWPDLNTPDTTCQCDCDDDPQDDGLNCITPDCRCCGVPIALIRPIPNYGAASQSAPKSGERVFEILLDGRREVRSSPVLTHIAQISWPHGGVISIGDFIGTLKRRIAVRFDRKLRASKSVVPGKIGMLDTGINPMTFEVKASVPYGDQRLVFSLSTLDNPPMLDKNDPCLAYLEIPESLLTGYEQLAGHIIHITLRCDFIHDCRGTPVDGDFFGLRLPSGDGIAGGTFESWFYLTNNYDSARLLPEAASESKDRLAKSSMAAATVNASAPVPYSNQPVGS